MSLYENVITSDAPAFKANVRQDNLEPGLRNGSIKEIDPDYREKLGLGPSMRTEKAASGPS